MKQVLASILMLCSAIVLGQSKNVNGKIYDQHPAIDIVDQFTDAFVKGDTLTMHNLTTEDFRWWQMNTMRPQPMTLNDMIGRSRYLSTNVIGFDIKNRGSAYSDAMEFGKGKDKQIHVYTYQAMHGYDQNTGIELNIPRNSIFFMNEDASKIAGLGVSDSQLKWQKAYDSWSTRTNGTIYKDHPMIAKSRLLYAYIALGDLESMRALYADNASIRDVMSITDLKETKTPDEEMEMLKEFYSDYEVMDITEIGYPDLLEYEGANDVTIISWWEMTVKNKKSGNISKGYHHSQITVNKEGLITSEDYYWNPGLLPK
jgi:ketosteroid isomerase-like protein